MDESQPEVSRYERLLQGLHRHRYALALLSFSAGLASFFLIQRQDWLAQPLALFLLVSWLVMLLETPPVHGPLTHGRVSPAVLRFLIQAVHQETFFFALPFFFATTTWTSPQAAFTVVLTVAGLAAMWDPLYYGGIARRRWLYLGFHALAIFVAMLVSLPILLHLTTTQSLGLAAAAIVVFTVPGLAQVLDSQKLSHWFLLLFGGVALGALAWLARPWVPPATLWVNEAMITESVDAQTRTPGLRMVTVPAAHAHGQGLYAYTAIRAPRGLREQVAHRWLLDGREVDRIPLEIAGGRAEGYRAWSYKHSFPQDPRGEWTVQVITEGGQLIGEFRFRVI